MSEPKPTGTIAEYESALHKMLDENEALQADFDKKIRHREANDC